MKQGFFLSFLFLSCIIQAQEQLVIDRAMDNVLNPVQLVDISKNTSDSYDAVIMVQSSAFTYNTTGMIVHGATRQFVEALRTYTFNAEGEFLNSKQVYISQNGGSKKIGDVVNSAEVNTISLNEVITMYPEIFKDDKYMSIFPGLGSVNILNYTRDMFTLAYEEKSQNLLKLQHPDNETEKKSIINSQTYFPDNKNGYIINYYGRKDVVNDDNKYNEMKDFDFITYNISGQVINQFNVKFPFPRNINKIFDVFSEDDPTQMIGKVFIFSRAMLFGKKYSDPEKNNFDIVYCSNDGKLILHKTSKMGTIEKAFITFNAAYGTQNSLKVLISGRIEDVLKAGIVQLNSDGSESVNLLTNEEIIGITAVVKTPKALPVVEPRSVLGFGNETLGFDWGLSSDFIVHGMTKASNGDLFIFGQMQYEVDDPNPTQPAPGTSTMAMTPKLKKYAEYVCIQIDPGNTVKKFYVCDQPVTGEQGSFTALLTETGKVILTVPVPLLKMGDASKQASTFYTLTDKPLSTYTKNFHYLPRLLVIDPVTTEAKTVGYADDYYLFDLEKSYLVDSQNNKIAIAGYSRDAKVDKSFVLKVSPF
jgi:hypothetical protein